MLESGFCRADLACGVALGRFPGIEFAFGHGLAANERRRAVDIGRGNIVLGPRALQIGFGLLDRDLVRPLIDDEKKGTLLDDLAITKMNGIDES